MIRRFIAMIAAAAAAVAGTMAPGDVRAHPHAYIDFLIELRFDAEGRVAALRQTWLFDEFYTAFVTAGADANWDGKPDPEMLEAVTRENIKNLAEYDYFTHVSSGEAKVSFGTASEVATAMRDQRLVMSFTLPLATPVSASDMPLNYSLYDPTYYIEMLHAKDGEPIAFASPPKPCTFEKKIPKPDADIVIMAASLGKNESGGDGLGVLFAEKVTVRCGS